MGLHQTPLLRAFLFLFLCIGSASGRSAQHSCPPSSCGDLHISYPFRLKGDRPTCGDRRYELTCDGNRTIIDINSGKYYVKSISYTEGDEHIRITDIGLSNGETSVYGVSFVNCTQEIQGSYDSYSPVPCLSGSNAFVYVILFDQVGHLAPSCRFLATVPADVSEFFRMEIYNVHVDAFEYLQKGISLKWINPSCDPVPFVIKHCYVRAFEQVAVFIAFE